MADQHSQQEEHEEHEKHMRRCRVLAEEATSGGDAPVGSLVLRDGQVIAEGVEAVKVQTDVTAHAEIVAIRKACGALGTLDLSGATLYTTTEPCLMCSYAIRQTRISTVVIEKPTEKGGGVTSPYPILTDESFPIGGPPPEIILGI